MVQQDKIQMWHYFKSNYTILHTEDYYKLVESIGVNYVHFDLAVMSSMNYNIFDYGTFGMWGAYLSQSEITIAADVNTWLKYRVILTGVKGFIFLKSSCNIEL